MKKNIGTIVHGIGSTEALDTSGERVILKGIDISSLAKTGVFNYEHENKQASQVVGKIFEAKKIFDLSDCENKHHEYFYEKNGQKPYLYIRGILFDKVGHVGAGEVAAMLRFDKEAGLRDGDNVINFSIEGGRLKHDKKTGIVHSCIARKVAITVSACNKTCISEILDDNEEEKEIKGDLKAVLMSVFKKSEEEHQESLQKAIPTTREKIVNAHNEKRNLNRDKYVQGMSSVRAAVAAAPKNHAPKPTAPEPKNMKTISGKDWQNKIQSKLKKNNMRKSVLKLGNPLEKERLEKEIVKIAMDDAYGKFSKKEQLVDFIENKYEVSNEIAITLAKSYIYAQEKRKEKFLEDLFNESK